MEKRINIQQLEPEGYKAMLQLEGYLQTSKVSNTHQALIKTRASQINGCASCLIMHTTEALSAGENPDRLFLLNAWRDSDKYTEEEKVVLALAEEVTLIHNKGLSDEVYSRAVKLFGEKYVAQLIMVVVTINSWNRIAVSTKVTEW